MSDTAIIPLTNHGYTIVDADLFEWLNQWKWYLSPEGYAFRYQKVRVGKFKKLYMHVAINQTPDGFRTDHINRIRIDNRKANLRTVTACQNGHNTVKHQRGNPHSQFKGVWKTMDGKRWVSQITANHKRVHIGTFDSEQEAAAAYNEAAERLQGEFCNPNKCN